MGQNHSRTGTVVESSEAQPLSSLDVGPNLNDDDIARQQQQQPTSRKRLLSSSTRKSLSNVFGSSRRRRRLDLPVDEPVVPQRPLHLTPSGSTTFMNSESDNNSPSIDIPPPTTTLAVKSNSMRRFFKKRLAIPSYPTTTATTSPAPIEDKSSHPPLTPNEEEAFIPVTSDERGTGGEDDRLRFPSSSSPYSEASSSKSQQPRTITDPHESVNASSSFTSPKFDSSSPNDPLDRYSSAPLDRSPPILEVPPRRGFAMLSGTMDDDTEHSRVVSEELLQPVDDTIQVVPLDVDPASTSVIPLHLHPSLPPLDLPQNNITAPLEFSPMDIIPDIPDIPSILNLSDDVPILPNPTPSNHAPQPQQTSSPLPVVPVGTTMIIQGVVQAAEESLRTTNRTQPTTVFQPQPQPTTSTPSSPPLLPVTEPEERSNSHAHLSGTFGPDQEETPPSQPQEEITSAAAELLGALLTAAASATANMLLTDSSASTSLSTETSMTNEERLRSSVGVGARPPRLSVPSNGERPRSFMENLRERIFSNGGPSRTPTADADAIARLLRSVASPTGTRRDSQTLDSPSTSTSDNPNDPIETLRERIASELMRALASRDMTASEEFRSSPRDATTPSLPMAFAHSRAAGTNGSELPEGSFERFLFDSNAELRTTLMERLAQREIAAAGVVPIPASVPSDQNEEAPSTRPELITIPEVVNRPAEGVIEPRLNWWRLHRFPPRAVAYIPNLIPSETPSAQPSQSESSTTPGERTSATSGLPRTGPLQTDSSTLIPVIVVGIRTAPALLVQEIGAMTSARSATAPETPDSPIPPTPSWPPMATPTSPLTQSPSSPRHPRMFSSTVRQFARRLERRRMSERMGGGDLLDDEAVGSGSTGIETPSANRTRNYLIWVIGGHYPEGHPILTSPNLLMNSFDQDDLWGLAELLGQVKPVVATKEDIEKAGLEIIKASEIAQYEREGKVTSNTYERCLICLGDYEPDEDVRIMSCKHAFHQPCVDKWMEVGRNNCPACRSKGVEVNENLPTTNETPMSGPSTST